MSKKTWDAIKEETNQENLNTFF